MRKINLLIYIMTVFLFLISFTSAVCTLTLDKDFGVDNYHPSESVIVTGSCSENTEKSTAYQINWTYPNGTVLESDIGTTPIVAGTNFFQTFIIPSDYSGIFNVTMTGVDLEGTDYGNVSGSNINSLIINNAVFSDYAYIGGLFATEFTVKDENGKKVNNALCSVYGTESDGTPTQSCGSDLITMDGVGHCDGILSHNTFVEGANYLAKILCSCGVGDNACYDEDGLIINASSGSNTYPFSISTWLNVNTVVDREIYELKNEISICANVTNVENPERIPMLIYHQARCSAGEDNNNDTDRVLIASDDSIGDHRGINSAETQMQCKQFSIPEDTMLQGRNSECYASTEIWVLNDNDEPVYGYSTTSPVFNVTSSSINVEADWVRNSSYKTNFSSRVNLSDKQYEDWDARGIGNIDIRLSKINQQNLDHTDQYGSTIVNIESLLKTKYIKSYSASYCNGTSVGVALEWLEDGLVELEIASVDITRSGCYDLEIELEKWEDRDSISLEDIANKTGTFHLDIVCEEYGVIGKEIDCLITAFIEDEQTVQKEVDFDCSIDGVHSAINFNQMITKNNFNVTRSFSIPTGFEQYSEHDIKCYAKYYNLGSRSDSFSDTFIVKKFLLMDSPILSYSGLCFIIICFIIIIIYFIIKKRRQIYES